VHTIAVCFAVNAEETRFRAFWLLSFPETTDHGISLDSTNTFPSSGDENVVLHQPVSKPTSSVVRKKRRPMVRTAKGLAAKAAREKAKYEQMCKMAKDKGWEIKTPHYVNALTKMVFVCSEGHQREMLRSGFLNGNGCAECTGHCPIAAAKKFHTALAEQGGRAIGKYVGTHTQVECLCKHGHVCNIRPHHIVRGHGMCLKCANKCPEQAGANFEAAIVNMGGRLVGSYSSAFTTVHCICQKEHPCNVLPHNIQQGYGMCLICANQSPIQAAGEFHETIKRLGGTVVGKYMKSNVPVLCLCAQGHECSPQPTHIRRGQGMCRSCAPSSYGELTTTKALDLLTLSFTPEFRFKPDRKRFDFCIAACRLIIEHDGLQHFRVGGWIDTEEDLLANQEIDRQKQAMALAHGFRMMRFDYSWAKVDPAIMAEKINWFIRECTDQVWVSNPELYQWLFQDPNAPTTPMDMSTE
jgi:very-short-patch-repair endonuclease